MLGESVMVAPVLIAMADMKSTMSVYFPEGVWFNFWTKRKVVDSRGQWEEVEVEVPALDSMAIWAREGAMICYAKEDRERTWNEAAKVVKVELYGNKSAEEAVESWECGDSATGSVTVVRDEEGRW